MISTKLIKKENGEIFDSVITCLKEGVAVRLRPKGSSMYPFIKEETDYVILSSVDEGTLRKNQIVLYKRESGQYVMHRIIKIENNMLSLRGDSQHVIEKDIPIGAVVGRATAIIRGNREIKVDSLSRKLLYLVWRVQLPIRERLIGWKKRRT